MIYPQGEKARGDFIDLYKYLMKGNEEEGAWLFSGVPSDKRQWVQIQTQYTMQEKATFLKQNKKPLRELKHCSSAVEISKPD